MVKIPFVELNFEELKEVVELPQHIICILSPDGTILKVSGGTLHTMGLTADEMLGLKNLDFIHPDDHEATINMVTSVFSHQTQGFDGFLARIQVKGGQWRWFAWAGRLLSERLYVHGYDIHEQIELEEKLRIQSSVLDNLSEAVLICDENELIAYANSTASEIFECKSGHLDRPGIGHLFRNTFKLSSLLADKDSWIGELECVGKGNKQITAAGRVTHFMFQGKKLFVIVLRDITEDKRISKERDEMELKFRAVFEQSPVSMMLFDLQGNVIDVNASYEKNFGSKSNLIKSYNLFEDPFIKERGHDEYMRRAIRGEFVEAPLFSIVGHPDYDRSYSKHDWLQSWFSPVSGPDGKVHQVVVTIRNVTEEVEGRRYLEELQLKFKTASESLSLAVKVSSVGVWERILDGNRLIWDETMEGIHGFPKNSFNGDFDTLTSMIFPDDLELCFETINHTFETGEPFKFEYRIIRLDGEVRWLQSAGMAVRDTEGKITRLIGTSIDITERKEAEDDQAFISNVSEILTSSFDYIENIQKTLDLAIEKYFDGATVDQFVDSGASVRIAVATRDPKMLDLMYEIHRKFYNQEGRPGPVFYGDDLRPKNIFEDFPSELKKSSNSPEYIDLVSKLNIKSTMTLTLLGKHGPMGKIGVNIGMSNHAKFNQRLQRIVNEMAYRISLSLENSLLYHRSQEAIRSRDEFLSIASHELKTPLQSLTLQNDLKQRLLDKNHPGAFDKTQQSRALAMDKRQLMRLTRLIDDMLDIARIRNAKLSIKIESFNLSTMIHDLCERMRVEFEANHTKLTCECPDALIIRADSYRIEQVVSNLLSNALKYGDGSPVSVRVYQSDNSAYIEVVDEGPGIRIEDQERIFNRFERSVAAHGISGLGLGLFIVKKIMELHGGKIQLVSKLGKGAKFIVELPVLPVKET